MMFLHGVGPCLHSWSGFGMIDERKKKQEDETAFLFIVINYFKTNNAIPIVSPRLLT